MKTLNSNYGKIDRTTVFNSFIGYGLTEMEMNYVRGGGDPPSPEPVYVIFPKP